jgi:hypothetical protein
VNCDFDIAWRLKMMLRGGLQNKLVLILFSFKNDVAWRPTKTSWWNHVDWWRVTAPQSFEKHF